MAREKKTAPVEDVTLTIEAVDPAPEVIDPVADNTETIKLLFAELDAEVENLGKVAHMYYVNLGRQRIAMLIQALKNTL